MQHVPFTHCSTGTPWKPLPSVTYDRSLPKDIQGMRYESWDYCPCEDFGMQLTRSKSFFQRYTGAYHFCFSEERNHENRHLQERGSCHMVHVPI